MRTKGRRRLDSVLMVGGGLVAGAVAALGAVVHNEERIDRMWAVAVLDADGSAALHEVIDYNFGNAVGRHGLLRRIPGLAPSDAFLADSPDAPDGISSIVRAHVDGEPGVEIKVGDAAVTVSGRHRYTLDYRLDTLTDGDQVGWNAVGTSWAVAVESSQAELIAPFELTAVRCEQGPPGSTDPCAFEVVEPGHVRVVHDGALSAGHGFTVYATRGADLPARPAVPPAPSSPAGEGAGIVQPAAFAALAATGGGLAASRFARRAGRERVSSAAGASTPTDAAFATGGSEQLVDVLDLADLATVEFAPPKGLTAPMGGIIHDESVDAGHQVAWLIEAAIAGVVDLQEEGGKVQRIVRLAPGDDQQRAVLDKAFGGKSTVELGTYDATFAAGWAELGSQLGAWAKSSGLWDADADRRKTKVRVLGTILGTLALGVAGLGGALAGRHSTGWLVLVAIGALGAGIGWGALISGWELRVRTPRGSALWLQVESFRRFLHDSEGYHAEEAARRGVLREYTAWAVAIGELDRWSKAVRSSTVIPESAGLGYVALAPALGSSISSTSTAPSSSSSGGGGGGSGGGGGGGGGGSW